MLAHQYDLCEIRGAKLKRSPALRTSYRSAIGGLKACNQCTAAGVCSGGLVIVRIINDFKFCVNHVLVLAGWRRSGLAVNLVEMLLHDLRRTEFNKQIHAEEKNSNIIERPGNVEG